MIRNSEPKKRHHHSFWNPEPSIILWRCSCDLSSLLSWLQTSDIDSRSILLRLWHDANSVISVQGNHVFTCKLEKKVLACLQVDQPLCLECTNAVKKEIENNILDAEAECKAYEEALEEISKQSSRAMPDEVWFLNFISLLHSLYCSDPKKLI